MKNYYSNLWFKLFMESVRPEQTKREVEFIIRHFPPHAYQSILDICCGTGRHSLLLADVGYWVTGVDRHIMVPSESLNVAGKVVFVELDMRELSELPGTFDGVINLWQSFGYFDDETNVDILRQVYQKLNPDGRLIMDIYHRGFFEQHQGERCFERQGIIITETTYMNGPHLTVKLDYGRAHEAEIFKWRLYYPNEICSLAQEIGFKALAVCTGFDEKKAVYIDSSRMQIVFEKVAGAA